MEHTDQEMNEAEQQHDHHEDQGESEVIEPKEPAESSLLAEATEKLAKLGYYVMQ